MASRLYTDREELQIVKRYSECKSTSVIGSEYGVTAITIHRILKRRGVKISSRGEANTLRAAYVDHNFFDIIDTEAKAWCLGLMFSDGNVATKKAEIWLCMADLDVIEKFRSCLKSESKIFKHPKKDPSNKQLYRLVFTSQRIKDALYKLGCTPVKSLTAKYPIQINSHMDRHFIRGLMDGDGCISVTTKTRHASITGTYSIVDGVKTVLQHNGIKCGNPYPHKGTTAAWNICISSVQALKLREYLYSGATLWMDRKYNKFNQLKQYHEQRNKKG